MRTCMTGMLLAVAITWKVGMEVWQEHEYKVAMGITFMKGEGNG